MGVIEKLKIHWDVCFVFFLLFFIFAYFYQDPGWNGNSRLGLTAAMVRDNRLTIDAFHADEASGLRTGDKAFYNGHYYTDKPIGSSLLAAVFYFPWYWVTRLLGINLDITLVKHILTLLTVGLPSALAGCLIYIVCKQISSSRWLAFWVTLALALGTMSFPFSVVFFGHQIAASLIFAAFFLIFQLKRGTLRPAGGWLALTGFLVGLAFITDMTVAVIILPLGLYYLYDLWQKKRLLHLPGLVYPILGVLPPLAAMLVYNLRVYHQLFVSGYEYLSDPYFLSGMSHGLMGIGRPSPHVLFYETLHPTQGIFWQSPVLLLALVGAFFWVRSRRYRLEGLLAILVSVSYLLMNAGYYLWWGGGSFAPRLMVPMLPFICLLLIFVPRRFEPLLIVLTLVSIGQMLMVAASSYYVPETYLLKRGTLSFFQFSAIYNYVLPQLKAGNFTWNLGQVWGLKGWPSLLPLVAVLLGAILLMAWTSTSLGRSPSHR